MHAGSGKDRLWRVRGFCEYQHWSSHYKKSGLQTCAHQITFTKSRAVGIFYWDSRGDIAGSTDQEFGGDVSSVACRTGI